MAVSIFPAIYGELQAQLQHNVMLANKELAQQAFDLMDQEAISDIILDGKAFWFEYPTNGQAIPDDVHNWLIAHLKQHGYTYLHSYHK